METQFSRNEIINEVKSITKGLKPASQETIIAVKPLPPAVSVEIEWSVPETRRKPARPQIAPDTAIVRIITFLTSIPM